MTLKFLYLSDWMDIGTINQIRNIGGIANLIGKMSLN